MHASSDALRAAAICERWLESIWDSYPKDALRLFRDTGDQFANPVGSVYRRSTEKLVEGLLGDRPVAELEEYLEPLIRVRAVQEMKASEAVSMISTLKTLAAEEAARGGGGENSARDVARFTARVDELLLLAFDLYVRCREEIFSIRVKEIRNRSLKTMERLNEWREQRQRTPAPSESLD